MIRRPLPALEHNDGCDDQAGPDDLPWSHDLTQEKKGKRGSGNRLQGCRDQSMSGVDEFDAFIVKPEGKNSAEDTDKKDPPP